MKRGLLDRIDRCRHVAVCHAHADGIAGLKGLGARSHTVIAVRDGVTAGKHLERRQGIERRGSWPRSDAGLLSIVRP